MDACRVSAMKAKARDMNGHYRGKGEFEERCSNVSIKSAGDRDELWSFHATCNQKIYVVWEVDYADKHTEIHHPYSIRI